MSEAISFNGKVPATSLAATWEITERPVAVVCGGADDQWMFRRQLKFLFGDMPVITFLDGSGLFGYLRSHRDKVQKPWLILLDMDAAADEGLTTLELLKASADDADIPVLVISSREDEEYIDRALQKGAQGIMPKPLKSGDFIEILHGREFRPSRDSIN